MSEPALQPQDIFAPSNLTPLSEPEIAALQYAAFMDHLKEVAALVEADKAADRAKEDAVRAAQDAREGAALTRVLNRLGFPVADLPHNVYIAPDGVAFSLSEHNQLEAVTSRQPVERQEADHFFLRVAFWHDPTADTDDRIYASRILGSDRRMTGEDIRDIQAALPAAIEALKLDVLNRSVAFVNAQKAAAQPVLAVEAPGPQFRTEIKTLDHRWDHESEEMEIINDHALASCLNDGWVILNLTVSIVETVDVEGDPFGTDIHRVVTLARQVPVEAVS